MPVQCHATTWTNADLLLIAPLGTNFSETQIKIQNLSFMKMHLKMLILGLRPANERQRYFVMTSLIGWAQS